MFYIFVEIVFRLVKNIQELVAQFEQESLPKEQWTHEAHLTVGCFYVFHFGKEKALETIRTNIKKYNVATGGENTDTAGYHETITMFWIWNINEFIKNHGKENTLETIIQQFISCKYADKSLPFSYYSKELLLSTAARLNFIEPDIASFV